MDGRRFVLLMWCGAQGAMGQYWANDFGGAGADAVADVKVDAAGNIYVTGEFSFSMTYDGTTVVSSGAADAFVAKLTPTGALAWIVRAGGSGDDRGLKLAVEGGGVVVITGQFSGTADIFGTTLTSGAGTLDVFTAQLEAATGMADWTMGGGASLGSDRPYGITRAPNGNVCVAGEFRGSATFSGQTIVSMIDPLTLQPGFDVFVASYDASGTLLWLQQGTAPHTDRAIDVVSDAVSNLYVCGQFSDTIAFDNTHLNALANATFLVKFDPAGVEQWFRRFGGASFDHVRDLQITSTGELLLCGDLQGTALFFDASPDAVNGMDPYALYLLRCDVNGEHIAHAVLGSDAPLSVAAIDQRGSTLLVLGDFQCQFKGLSDFYSGSGLFMATGHEDLFVARCSFPGLGLLDAQQFGGQHHKYPGGIASLSGGDPIFCGGYAHVLIFPSDGGSWGDVQSTSNGCPLTSVNDGMTYCGDPHYGAFSANNAAGATDGFLARAYVDDRSPYDAWNRMGSAGCDRSALEPCLMNSGAFPECPDTAYICGTGGLYVLYVDAIVQDLAFGYWENEPLCGVPPDDSTAYTGWDVDYQWSDGGTDHMIMVSLPGWYWCTVSAQNGCWSWTDSVYAAIESPLQPLISDGYGVNVEAYPTEPLICVDPVWLWFQGLPPGYTCSWTGPMGAISGDSIYADVSGTYSITVSTPGGCSAFNYVNVVIGAASPMPNITGMDLAFDFEIDTTSVDTVVQCQYALVTGAADITWYIDGLPAPPDPGLTMHVTDGFGSGYYSPMISYLTWFVIADYEGWHTIEVNVDVINLPCGSDTASFTVIDSVYIDLVSWSDATILAPTLICPGDTVPLVAQCSGCDSFSWAGPYIAGTSYGGDTAWVAGPGVYALTASGTYGGLTCPYTTFATLVPPPTPSLLSDPPNGIICPGATAIVYTGSSAIDYSWTGPLGVIPGNNDSIEVSATGDYYLTVTDYSGCVLTAGPLAIEEFGSPFISASPDASLCPGDDPIMLTVVVGTSATFSWNAPLSGSSPVQYVSVPGTYSCWVNSCGTNFFVSITILGGNADATLVDQGPFLLCEGDSVFLLGPDSMANYTWSPGGGTQQGIWVDDPGSYILTVFDVAGCTDVSEAALVMVQSFGTPLTAVGDTACSGEGIELMAAGSGSFIWLDGTGSIVGSGPSYSLTEVFTSDTLFVTQTESGCTSAAVAVAYVVIPDPVPPVIAGDPELCAGEALLLLAEGAAGSTYTWSTPLGVASGALYVLDPATSEASGTYQVIPSLSGCAGAPATVEVSIVPCGEIIVPTVFTPNSDGENDVLLIDGHGATLALSLFNRWGTPIAERTGGKLIWDGRTEAGELVPDGVYYYVLRIEGLVDGESKRSGYVQVLH